MKIITCASYFGSGSSAISDLVSEYENVKALSSFEFRFLHDLDGVSDLEYHLCECHNRHNSGHALKRFARLSHFNEGNILSRRYSSFFGKRYKELTDEYINELTDFTYKGWWFYDLYDKGYVVYYLIQIFNHLFHRFANGRVKILSREKTYCSHPSEETFLKVTQKYVSALMRELNKEGKEYLQIDQILPSSNIERVLRYFKDEVFVFVVDRDPRDIFTLSKHYWKDGLCPTDSVIEFCKWFVYARESGKGIPFDNTHIQKIQFEDLIYYYDTMIRKVEDMLGLQESQHIEKFIRFNPKRSVHNTQLWKLHNDQKEIAYIENNLKKYLYPFEQVSKEKVAGTEIKRVEIF